MRIDSGNIGMESARLYKSSRTTISTVGADVSGSMTGSQLTSSFDQFMAEQGSASEELKKSTEEAGKSGELFTPLERVRAIMSPTGQTGVVPISVRSSSEEQFRKLHEEFIRKLIELLSGKRNKSKENSCEQLPVPQTYEAVEATQTFSMTFEEREYTCFQATGTVKTDDGREFNLNLNLNMSRTFVSSYSESISYMTYRLTDPLVINLSDMPAEFTDATYYFDLDCDGESEELSSLTANTGFLALDKNGDGTINDGSELFGVKSGDGFKELAEYDSDHNGWIDENDDIFEKLKIWVKDSTGNDLLFSLKEKNIGAIYLGNKETEFSLNDPSHIPQGVIRKTGIFLYETGEIGTVQHVDLVS